MGSLPNYIHLTPDDYTTTVLDITQTLLNRNVWWNLTNVAPTKSPPLHFYIWQHGTPNIPFTIA